MGFSLVRVPAASSRKTLALEKPDVLGSFVGAMKRKSSSVLASTRYDIEQPPSVDLMSDDEFVPLLDQEKAGEAIKQARGWFQNLREFPPDGTWVCYAVPDPRPGMMGDSCPYDVICEWHPKYIQGEVYLSAKPYSEIKSLSTKTTTLEELKSFFLYEGGSRSRWDWQDRGKDIFVIVGNH